MIDSQLQKLSDERVIQIYAESAIAHGAAISRGDSKTANKFYEKGEQAYRELRRRGPQSQRAILKLLDLGEPSVRLWAASHTLGFMPERALPVLEEVAAGGGLIGFDAEMTLKEFKKGNLEFP